jgi:hypothetical protein
MSLPKGYADGTGNLVLRCDRALTEPHKVWSAMRGSDKALVVRTSSREVVAQLILSDEPVYQPNENADVYVQYFNCEGPKPVPHSGQWPPAVRRGGRFVSAHVLLLSADNMLVAMARNGQATAFGGSLDSDLDRGQNARRALVRLLMPHFGPMWLGRAVLCGVVTGEQPTVGTQLPSSALYYRLRLPLTATELMDRCPLALAFDLKPGADLALLRKQKPRHLDELSWLLANASRAADFEHHGREVRAVGPA